MPSKGLRRSSSPNEVGDAIRRFRRRAGVSTRELARRTGVAESYVSKVELGQLGARLDFCDRVARVLTVSRAERDLLDALAALQNAEHHTVPDGGALLAAQQAVRRFEGSCRSYRFFQLSLVPGLLQTREYMESLFSRLASPSRRAQAVRERLARQEILEDSERTFRFLITDWTLAPHWCSERAMRRQIVHLEKLAIRPNVQICILPRNFRFPEGVPPLVAGFEVLDEALVIVDSLTGYTTYLRPEEVAAHVKVFDEVFREALPLRFGRPGAAGMLVRREVLRAPAGGVQPRLAPRRWSARHHERTSRVR